MKNKTKVVRTVTALRKQIHEWRVSGEKVALVPTMGALHKGHLSLVQLAKKKADRVIVTIFVNPTQFGKNEDLSKYPRTEKEDKSKLETLATDLIYAPNVEQMYPEGFATSVNVEGITDELCGASRPAHFSGVATVVTKLLLQSLPDIAIFGEKDYQQLLVIKRFVTDLNIPVKILGGPIVREEDGLAMSSRNRYLSQKDRAVAPLIAKTMKDTVKKLQSGSKIDACLSEAVSTLEEAGFKIDYLELRDTSNLASITKNISAPSRLFVAAFLGKTRLIDNMKVGVPKGNK